MTTDHFTQALDWAAVEVRRSFVGCREGSLGNDDFGHLIRDIAAMAHDLGTDLDQLSFKTRQRPILDRPWRRQRAQKVTKIVGQRTKLKTNRVGGERPT